MEGLTVLYRRPGMAACLKPAGVSSEAGSPACPGAPELLAASLGLPPAAVRPVHRLDKAASGVLLCALDQKTAAALSRMIAEGRMEKTYLAVAEGAPEAPSGRWTDLLYWDRKSRKAYAVSRPRKGVKEAALSYRLLGQRDGLSLLSFTLETGRTHQIRVQCASRRLPLFGDARYGAKRRGPLALWCSRLCFPAPDGSGQLTVQAPPPEGEPWTLFAGLTD